MLLKFDSLPGPSLVSLLQFIHSEENDVEIPSSDRHRKTQIRKVVQLKAVDPKLQEYGAWYNITLEIQDWVPTEVEGHSGMMALNVKWLTRVYNILSVKQPGSSDREP